MKRWGFAVALEWACTLGAAGLWAATGVREGIPNLTDVLVSPSRVYLAAGLALLLLALIVRRFRTGRLFRQTAFDLPMLLFLLGALVGWWCAYNHELGLLKLHFLISAVAIYYLLAGAGSTAASRFILGFIVLEAAFALYYATQHDFAAEPLKSSLLTQIGRLLNQAVPNLALRANLPNPNPNVAAAVLALAVPFNVAWIGLALSNAREQRVGSPPSAEATVPRSAWGRCAPSSTNHLAGRQTSAPPARWLTLGASVLALACITFGLLMTTSRGAWVSLVGAAALWLVQRGGFGLGRRLLGDPRRARWVEVGLMAIAVLIGLGLYGVVLARTDWLGGVVGGDTAMNRSGIYQNALYQARDYYFTGAGLGTFEMVYSTYSLLIHVGFIPHAHNWYLQVWLEQGLLGLGALAWIVGLAVWLMVKASNSAHPRRWYSSAAGWAMVVMLLHGLVDAPLYGTRPTFLLLVPFGLLVSGQPMMRSARAAGPSWTLGASKWRVVVTLVVLGTGMIWHRQVLSAALSNLGTVEQTTTELEQYSWPEWPIQDEVRRHVDLSRPVELFKRALAYNPRNATANRRLGMIAMSLGQYAEALEHLEAAYASTPADNATRQLLGEAYIVNGQPGEGATLWATVNNDQGQLDLRAWWYSYIGDAQRAAWVKQVARQVARR